jgi:hypothetical protein
MKNQPRVLAILFLALEGILPTLGAQTQNLQPARPDGVQANERAVSSTREGRWREDLDYFAKELPARHKDFFKLISRKQFSREVADLAGDIPQISDSEIVLRLMRLVASLGVGHSRVSWPSGALAFRVYPVEMQWFSDGLAVVAAAPEYREAIGSRVVRIGSQTPEQVEAMVSPYVSHDNKAGLKPDSPRFMVVEKLLENLNLADSEGRLKLTLVKADRDPFAMEIVPAPAGQSRLVKACDALGLQPPLRFKQSGAFYRHEYLPDSRTLYLQYNSCGDAPDQPFAKYVNELLAFADSNAVQRLVLDLRNNGGGSSEVVRPLVKGLQSRPALSAKGHLYVLIGPRTCSSGMWAALEFRKSFRAKLIGEPTGGKPNAYGDVRPLTLPNSQLEVWYSTQYWHLIRFTDPDAVNPDICVTQSLGDFLAGRDPVLEAALSQTRK